jgi:bacteriorhodopsin
MDISVFEYNLVHSAFSFGIAVMGAATIFLFLSRTQVSDHYKTAVTVSGIVTLVAFYHYWRIFESWGAAFTTTEGEMMTATKYAFNDAYRYVDWLLTVPLLLLELILVMRLSREETVKKGTSLASLAVLMILLGYPGEISNVSSTRWLWWFLSMIPFTIIVYTLFVGLSKSISSQPESIRELVVLARNITVISWLFYPIVFILPMIGFTGSSALVAVQVGYTISDIVAKAGFGVLIWVISLRKSELNL